VVAKSRTLHPALTIAPRAILYTYEHRHRFSAPSALHQSKITATRPKGDHVVDHRGRAPLAPGGAFHTTWRKEAAERVAGRRPNFRGLWATALAVASTGRRY
jgi:hypothetical protein